MGFEMIGVDYVGEALKKATLEELYEAKDVILGEIKDRTDRLRMIDNEIESRGNG